MIWCLPTFCCEWLYIHRYYNSCSNSMGIWFWWVFFFMCWVKFHTVIRWRIRGSTAMHNHLESTSCLPERLCIPWRDGHCYRALEREYHKSIKCMDIEVDKLGFSSCILPLTSCVTMVIFLTSINYSVHW